jgi:hypothetical protein
MPEILAPRSFKWYMVCSCTMLSSWENPIQTSALQSINILVIFRKKSKTLISQQLSWAGKFSPWFCDPLGPTHHLIPLTQNRYVEVVLWEMDQLLSSFYVTLSKTKTKTIVQVLVLVVVLVGLIWTRTKTKTKIRNCTFSWKMKYLEEKLLYK